MTLREEFKDLLTQPIAFHRAFSFIAESVTAGVFLSQAFYWSDRSDESGWFYKTQTEWTEETSLTRYEQESARKKLIKLGILEEKLIGMPAKLHFRVNKEKLKELLLQYAENQQTRLRKTSKQQSDKPANKIAENQQTSLRKPNKQLLGTENTSENTAENSLSVVRARVEIPADEIFDDGDCANEILPTEYSPTKAIQIYRELFPNVLLDGHRLNEFARMLPEVEETVWRQNLLDWKLSGWQSSNISGLINRYKAEFKKWQKEQQKGEEINQNGTNYGHRPKPRNGKQSLNQADVEAGLYDHLKPAIDISDYAKKQADDKAKLE